MLPPGGRHLQMPKLSRSLRLRLSHSAPVPDSDAGAPGSECVAGRVEKTDRHTNVEDGRLQARGGLVGASHSPRARAGPVPWMRGVRDPRFRQGSLAWTHCFREVLLMTAQVSDRGAPLFPQTPREGVREARWIPEMFPPPPPPRPYSSGYCGGCGGPCERGHCGCLGLFAGGRRAQGVLQPLEGTACAKSRRWFWAGTRWGGGALGGELAQQQVQAGPGRGVGWGTYLAVAVLREDFACIGALL